MTGGKRKSARVANQHNYKEVHDAGFTETISRKSKKQAKKLASESNGKNTSADNTAENTLPGTSSEGRNETNETNNSDNNSTEINMGQGSNDSRDNDTSDVDSDEYDKQMQELQELELRVAEKRATRSKDEKRERKAKMAEMRRQAEEHRRELLESGSEGPTVSKRRRESSPQKKISKSKDGRGIKNKTSTNTGKQSKNKRKNKKSIIHSEITQNVEDSSSSSSENTQLNDTSDEEKELSVKHKKMSKTSTKKAKRCFTERKQYNSSSSESKDSSTDSSPDSSESSSEDSDSSRARSHRRSRQRRHKTKKGKPIRSGVKAKAHKIRLKTSELCAQAVLDEEHYPGTYLLENLTFEQLVAGELEICTMHEISKKEKSARLEILKLLAYFANILPQNTLLEVYKAVILKVEKGIFVWSKDIVKKTENMLDRAVSKNKMRKEPEVKKAEKEFADKHNESKTKDKQKREFGLTTRTGEKVIYCLEFNKHKCEKETSHEGKFAGREVFKQHICRACLAQDKEKRSHAENDPVCPNKST